MKKLLLPAIALLLLVKQGHAIGIRIESISPEISFTNTEEQAVFSQSFLISDNEFWFSGVRFRLHESVDLTVRALVVGVGTASFDWLLYNRWGDLNAFSYSEGVNDWENEVSIFQYSATSLLWSTGFDDGNSVTEPDKPFENFYWLQTTAYAEAGSVLAGWFEFTMTRVELDENGNRVPDGGSTLLLLGLALGLIGICRAAMLPQEAALKYN